MGRRPTSRRPWVPGGRHHPNGMVTPDTRAHNRRHDMAERLIVVGLDGSPGGRRALDWALQHALQTGAAVEVVSAWSWDGPDWAYRAGPGDERNSVEAEQEIEVQTALA